ncbi:MAG: phosphatidylserine decarboxylase [Chloroflexaceae bacterium]|nr:phosphatidylserine decarboxylase [Chloroflexaceae bacterium]
MQDQLADHIIHQPIQTLFGFDVEVVPLLGIGLGLTSLALGIRPRLASVPFALTALTAFLYRDPDRQLPLDQSMLFAAADGVVFHIDEIYEHRFLHTDAVRISTIMTPFDVAINRSPLAGTVRYVEYVAGQHALPWTNVATEQNTRTYIGLETAWGPVLIVQIAGPLARRLVNRVQPGDVLAAGTRIGTVRFGGRVDVLVQRDIIDPLIYAGQHLTAGRTALARLIAL